MNAEREPPSRSGHGAGVAGIAWRLARYQPGRMALGSVLWTSWFSLPLLIGLALRAAFDAIAGPAPAGLWIGSLIALVLSLEIGRLTLLTPLLLVFSRWWRFCEALLRTNLLQAQLASGGPEAGRPVAETGAGTGAAVAVFRDDVTDLVQLLDTGMDVCTGLLFTAAALPIMLRIDVGTTLVVVAPLLLAFLVTRLLTEQLRRWRRATREATARVTGFLGDVFSSVLTVKVAGAERAMVARLTALNAERRHSALRDRLLTYGLDAFSSSTVDVTIGLVLLLAAPAVRAGRFSVGDLVLFGSYVGSLSALPRWAGRMLLRQRQAEIAVGRMVALMPPQDPAGVVAHRTLRLIEEVPARSRPRPPAERPAAVQLRGFGFQFPAGPAGGGRGPGVSGVDLDLPAGSFTVVCGPVGSGKTTLLRALVGLAAPAQGMLRWNGTVVVDLAAHHVPPRCAYLPQVPRLLSTSLRENLTLGIDVREDALLDAVCQAALDGDVARMAAGLDTVVGPRGVRLSGGQIQRAATARALLSRPALLVLDDLSSALDAQTERRLWSRLLDGSHTRPTCLVVSHRAAALERADQVLLLDAGRPRAVGTLAELRAAGLDPLARAAR